MKLCLGFMTHITHTTGFSPVLRRRRDDSYVDFAGVVSMAIAGVMLC